MRKLQINQATVEQLLELPYIGEVRAKAIVKERQKAPFKDAQDLANRISGMGLKRAQEVAERVHFDVSEARSQLLQEMEQKRREEENTINVVDTVLSSNFNTRFLIAGHVVRSVGGYLTGIRFPEGPAYAKLRLEAFSSWGTELHKYIDMVNQSVYIDGKQISIEHDEFRDIVCEAVRQRARQDAEFRSALEETEDKKLTGDAYSWALMHVRQELKEGKITPAAPPAKEKQNHAPSVNTVAAKACHRCEGEEVHFACTHEQGKLVKKASDKVLGITGHRPGDLPGGWDGEISDAQMWVKSRIRETIHKAYEQGYYLLIAGGALGTDLWAAEAAIQLRDEGGLDKLKVILAIPHRQQWSRWRDHGIVARYWKVRQKADLVRLVSEGEYSAKALMDRNEYIVQRSDLIISVWNGKKAGGTYDTIRRALESGVKVYNFNPAAMKGHVVRSL